MDFLILDISWKWNNKTFYIWCLSLSIIEVHPFCSMSQYFILFCGWEVVHCMSPPLFFFKIVLAITGPLQFLKNFRINSSIWKKARWDFDKDWIESKINLGSGAVLTLISIPAYEHWMSFHTKVFVNFMCVYMYIYIFLKR